MDPKTFDDYLTALKDLYILEDIEAWNPNIRSKTAIRSTPTRHFVDPSLACCALGISPADLLGDLESFGLFFEDLAVRDLSVYATSLGGGPSGIIGTMPGWNAMPSSIWKMAGGARWKSNWAVWTTSRPGPHR